jgi:hypothetical protein
LEVNLNYIERPCLKKKRKREGGRKERKKEGRERGREGARQEERKVCVQLFRNCYWLLV